MTRNHPRSGSALSIGQFAARAGLSVAAIRYYERLGLLPSPPRTGAGRRRYPPEAFPRLALINQAKALGLTLTEIRQLLADIAPGAEACRAVHRAVERHVAAVDRQLATLSMLRDTLVHYRDACARALAADPEPACPTLRSLERDTLPSAVRDVVKRPGPGGSR